MEKSYEILCAMQLFFGITLIAQNADSDKGEKSVVGAKVGLPKIRSITITQ